MVRKITVMIVAIAGVLASAFPAYAQKGEKTLGIAGGFASYNTSGYVDVYFQYSFAEHVRIAPEVGYIFRNDGKSGFAASVDMHFPFRVARGFKLYRSTTGATGTMTPRAAEAWMSVPASMSISLHS